MKKTKKLLSILLSVVMIFSVIAVPVSAAVPASVTTLESLVQPTNLAQLVDWLLTNLNNRKDAYIDTVLNFVCTYVEDINVYVEEKDKENLFASNDTAAKAKYLLDYVDVIIAEADLEGKLGTDAMAIINKLPITLDLKNINGILSTIKTLNGILKAGNVITLFGVDLGHILELDLSALLPGGDAMQRSDTNDIKIVLNLIEFLNDNTTIVKAFLDGSLTLGDLDSVVSLDAIKGKITPMIKDLVYTSLLGAPDGAASHATSAYKNWTVDQMAIGALVKMLTGVVPADTEEIDNFLDKSVYDLLASYGDRLYNTLLVDVLRNDLLGVIKSYTQDNALAQYFKLDATFVDFATDFGGKVDFASNGLIAEINNLVVALMEKLIADDVLAKLDLKKGGNENLNANLEKLVKYILPRMAAILNPDEFDFSMYTEDYVADKTLGELAPGILKIFYPEWFNLDDAGVRVVSQIDTMGEAATLAVYYALITFNADMFAEGNYDYISEWNAMIFEADGVTLKDLGNSEWADMLISMAADAAMFGVAINGSTFYFDFTMDDVKAKKAAGWTAEAFLDEIADWAIDMVKGIPAVTDHIAGVRGKVDNYGPFYKLNVLLNEILDWSFLNGVSYGSFNLDVETLIFDGLLGNLYEFNIAGILDLFADNDNANNLLNKNTVPALLSVVDNVLNVLFSHSGSDKKVTVAATCDHIGFTVTACSKCGVYKSGYKETAKKEHELKTTILTASTCEENGLVRYTCENCDYVLRETTNATGHKFAMGTVEIDGVWKFGNICAFCDLADGDLQLAPVPDRIEVTAAPAKTDYTMNSDEELDLNGLVVKEIYNDGYTRAISNDLLVVLTELDLSKAGEQIITISYLGRTATFKVTVVDPNEPTYILGDADGNGEISSGDARLALRVSVGLETLTGVNAIAADYDLDGKITASDARAILRFSVGLSPLG